MLCGCMGMGWAWLLVCIYLRYLPFGEVCWLAEWLERVRVAHWLETFQQQHSCCSRGDFAAACVFNAMRALLLQYTTAVHCHCSTL